MSKLEKLLSQVKSELPPMFTVQEFNDQITVLSKVENLSAHLTNKLIKKIKPVAHNFYSFNQSENFEFEDILIALSTKYYLSHHTALFYNELTDQRPNDFFLTKEVKNRKPQHSKGDYVEQRVKQAFLKSPQYSENFFKFKKYKFTLLEKHDLGKIGVIKKKGSDYTYSSKPLLMTGVERTLIDSIVRPHYSGGIQSVLFAFSKKKIDVDFLHEIYQQYSFYYPYWQSIGFVLENYIDQKTASKWKTHFNQKMKPFYLDRGFRSSWKFDKSWSLHYPKGIK